MEGRTIDVATAVVVVMRGRRWRVVDVRGAVEGSRVRLQ